MEGKIKKLIFIYILFFLIIFSSYQKELFPEAKEGSKTEIQIKEVVAGPFLSEEDALKEYKGKLTKDLAILETNPKNMNKGCFVLKAVSIVITKDFKDIRRTQDFKGNPAISIFLNSRGAFRLKRFTTLNRGKRLAIVLGNRIMSVATIKAVISSDVKIKGRFTIEEVDDLVEKLKTAIKKKKTS